MKKFALVVVVGAAALCSLVFAQPPIAPPAKPPKIELAATKLPEKPFQDKLLLLLDAIEANSYATFVGAITDEFKTDFTRKRFEEVAAYWVPRLEKGYDVAYMGELNRDGLKTYVWKIAFRDGGGDMLSRLSLKSVPDEEKQAAEKVAALNFS